MAIVSFEDIYGKKTLQEKNTIFYRGSLLIQQRTLHIKNLIKVIVATGALLGVGQVNILDQKTGFGFIETPGEPGKEIPQAQSFISNESKITPAQEANGLVIDPMPDLSEQEQKELTLYMRQLEKDFATLKWENKRSQSQVRTLQKNFEIVSKNRNLLDFYKDNRKIIDNMARFSGRGTLTDVCGSTILIPWILYTSDTIKEAWENIRQLTQINYKHGKNWSIMLEALVKEGIAEKINPHDLLKNIPEGTILTYDGSQSSGEGRRYGHVEMTLAQSSLDDGHFYYGNENTRAGGSASSRIKLQSAIKLFGKGIGLLEHTDVEVAKGLLGGLIGGYKIKLGATPNQVIAVLVNTDIKSKQEDIPLIAISNYSTPQ